MAEGMGHLRRTHNCVDLSKKNVGEEVILTGWIQRRRDHGGVIFIDLRDRFGLTQVVFSPDTQETVKLLLVFTPGHIREHLP